MTRQNNHSIAHRRASKPSERYVDPFYSPSIAVPPPYFNGQSVGMPMSAPAHFANVPFITPEQYTADSARRPPFKQMQSAPGTLYTLHGPHEGYSQFPGHPHYTAAPQDTFHPPSDEAGNAFWKLSVTSPSVSEAPLPPPPRGQNQWAPNANSNYTHERPNSSVTLPTPHHAFNESQAFPPQPQYFTPTVGPVAFQNSPQGSTHSSQPHDEHCEGAHWSRSTTSGVRNGN